jgi:lipopolysaccharide export system protein LptC
MAVAPRMKNSATSTIPLVMLLLLAALTFWLSQVIQGRTPRGPLRHDPDYWAERFVLRRFDINGSLQHTLVGEKVVHYPDDDTTIVTEPHLTYHQLPRIEAFARMAYLGPDGKEVDLVDEVKVIRHGATDDLPPTVLETKALKVFPDEEKASSKDPVILTRGASVLRGTGFETDNSTGITVLHGRVTGTFHQNRTEKR